MMCQCRLYVLATTVFLLALPTLAGAAPGRIDCDKGNKSLAAAVAAAAPGDEIEFSGTCVEDIRITADGLTLRGVGAAPTIVGVADPANAPTVEIVADRVALSDFEITGAGTGVVVRSAAGVTIDRLTIGGMSGSGVLLFASSARVADLESSANGGDGIGAWNGTSLTLAGSVTTSDNGRIGILASDSALVDSLTTTVESSRNVSTGIWCQLYAGCFLIGSVRADDNGFAGAAATGAALSLFALRASGNDYGVFLYDSGQATLQTGGSELHDNGFAGVYARTESRITIYGGASIRGNGIWGVRLDGATAWLVGLDTSEAPGGTAQPAGIAARDSSLTLFSSTVASATGVDVELTFGSRATFGGNTIGAITCDGTVLTEGDASCPSSLTSAPSWRRSGAEVRARGTATPGRPVHPWGAGLPTPEL